jgi:hypothetical protein
MNTIKQQVKETLDAFLDGTMPAAQAVAVIDTAIGGITKFTYKAGLCFTIQNHIQRYSCPVPQGKYEQKLFVEQLLPMLQNYCNGMGQAHISKFQSTKHHCAA